ncbi:hypothetical protein MTO96_028761 [Rhipicephalus appendiculatus]
MVGKEGGSCTQYHKPESKPTTVSTSLYRYACFNRTFAPTPHERLLGPKEVFDANRPPRAIFRSKHRSVWRALDTHYTTVAAAACAAAVVKHASQALQTQPAIVHTRTASNAHKNVRNHFHARRGGVQTRRQATVYSERGSCSCDVMVGIEEGQTGRVSVYSQEG